MALNANLSTFQGRTRPKMTEKIKSYVPELTAQEIIDFPLASLINIDNELRRLNEKEVKKKCQCLV